jgi:hypothetical protein
MIYTDTNYATRYRYLCSVVHCVKNQFPAACAQILDDKECMLKVNRLACMETKNLI